MPEITKIQQRRGTASQWTTINPILDDGVIGWEEDTQLLKVGDGVSSWTNLPYAYKPAIDGKAPLVHTHVATDISDSTVTGRSLIKATDAAAARSAIGAGTSSLVIGTGSTNAMAGNKTFAFTEITGTLGTAQLPPLAVNEVFAPANQAGMLALTAQRGDMAIRVDTGDTYVLATDSPTTLADWKLITSPGNVTSVAGRQGAVVLAKADVGLSNVDNTADASKPVSSAQQTALNAKENTIVAGTTAQYYRGDKTWATNDKASVGLGNVDNTADASKPVSSAQQTALNLKANTASPTFTGTVGGITKAMVGLSSVDNTSDASKPVSTAMATALAGKAATSHTHVSSDIPVIDGGTP